MDEGNGSRARVLWLIKGLGMGGAERLLVETAHLADRSRFTFDVAYLLEHKDQLRDSLQAAGVTAHCLHAGHEADVRWARRLRALVLRERYDIVHAHSPYAASVARVALRVLPEGVRPKLFYTEHEQLGLVLRTDASRQPIDRPIGRCALCRIPRRTCVDVPTAARRHEVITQGISLRDFQPSHHSRAQTRKALDIGDDEILAITVANLRTEKAYPDLLEAARLALTAMGKHPVRLRFAAVGQGPQAAQVADQHRRLGLGSDFLLLGQRSDVVHLLLAADLFVLSSHFEGLPIALLEAMAAGLPAVVTSVGGVPDVVRDGKEGRLVPPRRPDLLAASLVELATDPILRSRLATGARLRAVDFDLEQSVERLQQSYAAWCPETSPAA